MTTFPTIADGQFLASRSLSDDMLDLVEHLAPHRRSLTAEEARRLLVSMRCRSALAGALLLDVLTNPTGRVDLVAHLDQCTEQDLLIELQRLLADLLQVHEARRSYARRRSLDTGRPVTPRRTRRERKRAQIYRSLGTDT